MSTDSHEVEKWMPIAEAAEELGTTPLNVLMHIKRGLMTGLEHDGDWRVDPESVSTLIRKRQEGEVSDVCQSSCAKQAGGCGSCA